MLQFVTIVTPHFWPGFAALLQSLADNGGFDQSSEVRWLLICEPDSAPRSWLASRPEALELFPLSELPRVPLLSSQNQGKRMETALQKLGIFALPETLGKCVYLDSDMICLNQVKELRDMQPITAAYDHLQLMGAADPLPADQPTEFNTGVLVFSPKMQIFDELCETYRAKHAERSHKGDQDVFFFWAQNQTIHPLTSEWNFSKRHQDRVGARWVRSHLAEIKFLHFVGVKPWTDNSEIRTFRECHYRRVEELWWDYFERSGFAEHMDHPPKRSTAFIRQCVLPWTKGEILSEHLTRAVRFLKR